MSEQRTKNIEQAEILEALAVVLAATSFGQDLDLLQVSIHADADGVNALRAGAAALRTLNGKAVTK